MANLVFLCVKIEKSIIKFLLLNKTQMSLAIQTTVSVGSRLFLGICVCCCKMGDLVLRESFDSLTTDSRS